MAVIKNITPDVRTLFRADAPPIDPDGEITVRDENVIGRAWPKSTWKFVEPPKGHEDVGGDDAYLFEPKTPPAKGATKKES